MVLTQESEFDGNLSGRKAEFVAPPPPLRNSRRAKDCLLSRHSIAARTADLGAGKTFVLILGIHGQGFLSMHGRQREGRKEEMARIEFPANELRLPRPFYAPWKLPMTRGFRRGLAVRRTSEKRAGAQRRLGDPSGDVGNQQMGDFLIWNTVTESHLRVTSGRSEAVRMF